MLLKGVRKSNEILSDADVAAMQQPLDNKTGRTNPLFDKLYGHKTKNPWSGTERDVKNKKASFGFSEDYAVGWERIFGNK